MRTSKGKKKKRKLERKHKVTFIISFVFVGFLGLSLGFNIISFSDLKDLATKQADVATPPLPPFIDPAQELRAPLYSRDDEFTDYGYYRVRNNHPRVFTTADHLMEIRDKCIGPDSREPYIGWYEGLIYRADAGNVSDLMNLALLANFTEEQQYIDMYLLELDTALDRLDPGEGEPLARTIIGSMDIMWDYLNDELKLKALRGLDEANSNSDDLLWRYHSHNSGSVYFGFAALFADDPILESDEVVNNPDIYPFNVNNFLAIAFEELSETGHFYRCENFLAGDYPNPYVLQGICGGMYDNFGYETNSESWEVYILLTAENLADMDILDDFAHTRCRGYFYHSMAIPHKLTFHQPPYYTGAIETNQFAKIWNTQTDWMRHPIVDVSVVSTYLYDDSYMQYFVETGDRNDRSIDTDWDGVWLYLLFYDDALEPIAPYEGMPLADYFSGSGFVTMREDLSTDALYSVFMSSDHLRLGRRYEDANSFLLDRGEFLVPHGGARIRNQYDNGKHHNYHIRSWSKNTLRFMDPDSQVEACAYFNPDEYILTDDFSNHLGGQMCHTDEVTNQKVPGLEDVWYAEFADITKYYHDDEITYTLGEAAKSYEQVNYFDREYLYLRPDTIVIFDKYEVIGDDFRKSFRMHTIPEPIIGDTPITQVHNAKTYDNIDYIEIEGDESIIHMNLLYPTTNQVTTRGGDYALIDAPLDASNPIITTVESDIPRWLEVWAGGIDTTGTLTIHGETAESPSDTETILLDSKTYTYWENSDHSTGYSETEIYWPNAGWENDQWVGYMAKYGSSDNFVAVITDNDDDTIYGDFSGNNNYGRLEFFRYLNNTIKHWKRIDSITTTDLDLTRLVMSSPEYYDIDDYTGQVHTFSPHTAGFDAYRKRLDLGQYNINIEGDRNSRHGNFLNVLYLNDVDAGNIATNLLSSSGEVIAAVVQDKVVVFSKTQEDLSTFSFTVHSDNLVYVFDCSPNTYYYVISEEGVHSISTSNNGGVRYNSNNMGILTFSVGSSGQEICYNGVDDDWDGYTDCEDSDCHGQMGDGGICEFGTELTCDDGFDNDADNYVDDLDSDCESSGLGVLLYSKLDSDQEVFEPTIYSGQMPSMEDAVVETGNGDVTYEAGPDGLAALLDGSHPNTEKLYFDDANFDFADLDNDGGRMDLWIKFNEDPHAIDDNRFMMEAGTAHHTGSWMFSMETGVGTWFMEFQSDVENENIGSGRFNVAPTGIWDNIQQGEWHLYTLTWRRNYEDHKAEMHLYIDGSQEGCSGCNEYNGNLPAGDSFVELRFGPHYLVWVNPHVDFTMDELWSFDRWDFDAAPGTYADIQRPEGVTLTYPYDDYNLDDSTPTLDFIVINDLNEQFNCDLHVDGSVQQSQLVYNDVLSNFVSEELDPGEHTWQVICDGGRLISDTWTLNIYNIIPCEDGEEQDCITTRGCPGTQTCSDGYWEECMDIPGDGCPVIVDPVEGVYTFQNGLNGYTGELDGGIMGPHGGGGEDHLIHEFTRVRKGTVTAWDKKAVIRFDTASIPQSSIVNSATLEMYQDQWTSSDSDVIVYKLLKDWVKAGVTWHCTDDVNQDGGCYAPEAPWGEGGIIGGSDRDDSGAVTTSVTPNSWNSWDVTEIVQEWVNNPPTNYGLLIEENDSVYQYFANGYNSEQTLRPRLIVETEEPTIPIIYGVDGPLEQGQNYTITGAGFGFKGNVSPLLYDTLINQPAYEGLGHGDTIPTGDGYPWGGNGHGGASTDNVQYWTSDPRISGGAHYHTLGKGFLVGHEQVPIDAEHYYVSWYVRFNGSIGHHATKLVRIYHWEGWDGCDVACGTWVHQQLAYSHIVGDPPNETETYRNNVPWDLGDDDYNEWHRLEVIVNNENRLTNEATYDALYDCQTVHDIDDLGGFENVDHVRFIGFEPNNHEAYENFNADFGEFYIDTTFARIEIGNAPAYDDCTHREIQIPHTTWNDGIIEFTANLGTFDSDDNLSLFVVNENGNVSEGYPIPTGIPEDEICDNGRDDDWDGYVDCEDSDCDGQMGDGGVCEFGTELTCDDGFDNDADSYVDNLDDDCQLDEICDNGDDDDGDGYTDCDDSDCTCMQTYNLEQGLNFIAMSLRLDDMSIETVFEPILDDLRSIYTYEDYAWKVYHKGAPELTTLNELRTKQAYIVVMNDDSILALEGNTINETISLDVGWNLVGISEETQVTIEYYLGENVQYVNSIWEWDVSGDYTLIDESEYGITYFEPGKLYWIEATQSFRFSPEPPAGSIFDLIWDFIKRTLGLD